MKRTITVRISMRICVALILLAIASMAHAEAVDFSSFFGGVGGDWGGT